LFICIEGNDGKADGDQDTIFAVFGKRTRRVIGITKLLAEREEEKLADATTSVRLTLIASAASYSSRDS
jgi:hypothetical protein